MANFHVIGGAHETLDHPEIRKIGISDLFDALRRGIDDFWEKPSHYVLLTIIYPLSASSGAVDFGLSHLAPALSADGRLCPGRPLRRHRAL